MEKFELRENYTAYASSSNPAGLSVRDRLPRSIDWSYGGTEFKLECSDGLIAKFFEPNIFVIEAPYVTEKNRARIFSVDGKIVADLPRVVDCRAMIYYDILSLGAEVVFLASTNAGDLRLNIDLITGKILSIREFR